MSDTFSVRAHAKINIFLRVFARDETDFHGLETVFCLLELSDTLEVSRTDSGVELTVEGADLGQAEDNLVTRAARQVLAATGNPFGVRFRLIKQIPPRAGLGGGSSDAAAALHATNRLAGGVIPREEILQMAARLGSDVPFFASEAAMALAWNRGERMYRLRPPPPAPVLLVLPEFGIDTPAAYRLLDASRGDYRPRGSVLLEQDAFSTWGGVGRLGGNDFESPIFHQYPEMREIYEKLAETRPLTVRMSGSGSAIFAVFKSERERDDAALTLGSRDKILIKTATRG